MGRYTEGQMKKIDTGGPAFPVEWYKEDGEVILQRGMTLRQYYKGQAIIGILSGLTEDRTFGLNCEDNNNTVATVAGAIADALIREDLK